MANKNILLIEPAYKNKYPPLGLMKLAAYHGPFGKRDRVKFVKGELDRSVLAVNWDRIYVTTLFSFEWREISKSIDFAVQAAQGNAGKVFVGGIAASLMHGQFLAERRWLGIRFIKGLLSQSPAESLQLDDFEGELYADDRHSTPIEDLVPDYSILEQIEDQYIYPVHDAYFTYASRGCVRKCTFCGVPKLEGAQRDAQPITSVVRGVEERYGAKKDLLLMDNNVVASGNYKNIIAEIRDLGFERGAKLHRPGRAPIQRRVDFNQGVDARILCKDEMYLREMSTICIKPLRIAFDHIGARKPYETAIRISHQVGLHELSNYMLYNFHDSPTDLYQRMRLNIDLNEELGIRIFSFPMRYQPTDMKDRSYIGESWSRYHLRSMQIILQATHGIVSGSPDFFKKAFGDSAERFSDLLLWPQHFLFNRDWYQDHGGKSEFEAFEVIFRKLTTDERGELTSLLSSVPPSEFRNLISRASTSRLKKILDFYAAPTSADQRIIWEAMRTRTRVVDDEKLVAEVPVDELVEDAGLAEAV
jgi:hypothetical protein